MSLAPLQIVDKETLVRELGVMQDAESGEVCFFESQSRFYQLPLG